MNEEKISKLRGKIIKEINVTNNNYNLNFVLDNNEIFTFKAMEDCCSESWIEHFDEINEPSKIIDFIEIDIPPTFIETDSKHNVSVDILVQYYFYKLITEKGEYLIEMRNSSNGYYGGYLS